MTKAQTQVLINWIALAIAVVGLGSAVATCRTASIERRAKIEALLGKDSALARVGAEQACRKELERQGDRITEFMLRYNGHLKEIGDASSRLAEFNEARNAAGARQAELDLANHVQAYIKFVREWRQIHSALGQLLDGDVTRMEGAHSSGQFAEVRRLSGLLARNASDKEAILREQVRTLSSPAGPCTLLR